MRIAGAWRLDRIGAAVVIGCGMAVALTAQQQKFRATTDLVAVYATVTDSEGRLVTDLTQDRFVVRDNGKVQPIALFSNDIQPITIIVMLDRSGSMTEHFGLVQRAAGDFIDQLLPDDRARIGGFGDQIVIRPDAFTSDQTELQWELANLRVRGASPLWMSLDRSITALQPESGRRALLVFTDGHDRPGQGQIHTTLEDITRRSIYNEVMVYTIGFTVRPMQGQPGPPMRGRGMPPGRGGPPGGGNPDKPDPGLQKLAADTGGGYFELKETANLGATFKRVADELHHQYLLAFKPTKLDMEEHKLEVRLKDAGNYTVRSRRSYIADPKR